MAHALRYYKNIVREDGKRIRIEFHEKDGTAAAMELGDVIQSLNLEIQGGGDIDEPIVKTMLNFTLVDAPDHPDHKTKKCGSWEEFYSPDATRWKVLLLYKNSGETSYTQFWGGYITPDSFRESLTYRGSVSFVARDNIGHMQDFPFDAEGNADGMISLYELLTEAWAKIESPMELVTKTDGDVEWLKCEGGNALFTYMNVSAFEEKNWLDAVTDALYGYGLVMRYVGENKVYVYPLRNLPVFPYGGSGVDVLFEAGAERELSPAVKRIEESVGYELLESLPQPLVNNKKDFSGSVEKVDFTMEGQPYTIEYWKLNRTKAGDGWINGDSLPRYFNPLGYSVADNVDDKDLSYMWLASAYYVDVANDGRAVEYSRYIQAASLGINVQLGHTYEISNGKLARTPYNALLFGCTLYYMVSISQNGITKYLNSKGEWTTEKKSLTLDIQDAFTVNVPQGDFSGEVLLSFKIIDIRGAWGAVYIPVYSVTYTTTNTPLLSENRVNTNYNEQNNIILSRSPRIAPAMDKTFMQGVIKNGIFTKQGSRYNPAKLWSWNANGTGAQQMAVYNHLQLLCYYAKPNNVLSGTILNADVTNIGKVYRWEGTEHLLVSGTLNLINGFIEGATLREFARYEDMWGEITDTADLPEVEGRSTNNVDGGVQSGGNTATYSNTYEVRIGGEGGTMVLDTYMSDSSTNGVQNKVIKAYVDSAVDTLETSIGTKAKQSDLTALQTRVSSNETAIADRYTKSDVDAKVKTLTDADTALGNRITPLETWKTDKDKFFAKFYLGPDGNVYCDTNLIVKEDTSSGGSGDPSTNQGIDIAELKKYLDDNAYIDEGELNTALSAYATTGYVQGQISGLSTAIGQSYATKDFVADELAKVNLYTDSDVAKYLGANGYINEGNFANYGIATTTDVSNAVKNKADKGTKLSDYGITDAKIANGVITLGNNTITPLTSHQSLAGYATETFVTNAVTNASSGLAQVIATKVDKVTGKGLSTNDFTDALLTKLNGIASGAQVNVQSDWNATSGDAFIKNKPTLAAVATSGAYGDLTGRPSLAAVATSGKYSDLSGTPSIPTWALATSKPSYTTTEVTEGTNLYFTNARAISAVMGASAIGGTTSYIYWTGSSWASKALGTRAFDSTDYLPLSGGTITGGKLYIKHTENPFIEFKIGDEIKGGIGYYSAYGTYLYNSAGKLGIKNDGTPYYSDGTNRVLLHTGNYSSYALPIGGGRLKGNFLDLGKEDNVNGAFTRLYINAGTTAEYGTNLRHYYSSSAYRGLRLTSDDIYYDNNGTVNSLIHSGNIGSQSVNKANKLATARTIWGQSFDGTGNVNGSINGDVADFQVNAYDGSARYNIIDADSNNAVLYFGYGSAPKSYKTRIAGESVVLHYGTSKTTGFVLNSSGNVTIGTSDLAGTSAKLCVDGDIVINPIYCSLVFKETAYLKSYGSKRFLISNQNGLFLGLETTDVPTYIYGKNISLETNTSIKGTLSVTGAVTMASTLTIAGQTTIQNNLIVTGDVAVS